MKSFLLSSILFFCTLSGSAQDKQVHDLPAGKYETVIKNNPAKWERGDIILLDAGRYKISTSAEVGEYKFSSTAQRVFFTSGPLKSMFAKTSFKNDAPAIVLPVDENERLGLKLPAEVWGYYKN
jgi:hypothetical protein